ncbi:hypothetical protein RHSIM_Rhsim10G0156700 [Rhododendron simsii]|uniref:MADS-box domain-containing protein n=1 Tax=Rhododendron simsii TaxID=118357 RepID=A0A834LC87_RHOSS|nr:hypothetical protein RHSIM_Rhsim10G0156700 [Rhododendron simsii]
MGRKIEMKKIEDITRCQVTFSKRRTSLMKKAHEISSRCNAEVAFVAFSPSGRVSKFSSQTRIEDVIRRYLSLPIGGRYPHYYFLISIRLPCFFRDYEPHPEQDPSLHQLLWCQRNLKQSLERVVTRKNALIGRHPSSQSHPNVQIYKYKQRGIGGYLHHQVGLENRHSTPNSHEYEEKGQSLAPENPSAGKLMMQLDPWISPYSAKVWDSIIQTLVDQSNCIPSIQSPVVQVPVSSGKLMITTLGNQSIPLAVNGPFCTLSASTPKGLDLESLGSHQAQIGLDQWQPENDSNINEPMFFNPKPTLTQHKNVKQADQPNSENIQSNSSKNNESGCANEHQSVQSPPKVLEASLCDSLPLEDNVEDNKLWTKGIEESELWEWDDLLMVDNMKLEDLENFF